MSVAEAQATGHEISLCMALALAACPTALWVGNLAAAAHYTGMLLEHSRQHSLPHWSEFGSRFQKVVVIRRGDLDTGLRLLRAGADDRAEPSIELSNSLAGLTSWQRPWPHAGRIAEGLALAGTLDRAFRGRTGSRPSCCASRANFFYCRALLQSRKRRRPFSGKRWTKRASKARCLGSCAPRRASPACSAIKAAPPTPSPAFGRSTTALPRVSGPPISSRRNNFWMTWTRVAAEHRPVSPRACFCRFGGLEWV